MTSEIYDLATTILHDNHAAWTCAISVFNSAYNVAPTSHLTTEGAVHQPTASNAMREDNEGPFVVGILGNGRRGEERSVGNSWKGCTVNSCCCNWICERQGKGNH